MSKAVKIKPTVAETASAHAAAETFNDFVTRFVPAARNLKTLTASTPNVRATLAGRVSASAASRTSRRDRRSPIRNARRVLARASGTAQGAVSSKEALVNRERQGLQKLVAFGRGIQFDTNNSLTSAAAAGTRKAITVADARQRASAATQNAIAEGIGQIAGGVIGFRQAKKADADQKKLLAQLKAKQ